MMPLRLFTLTLYDADAMLLRCYMRAIREAMARLARYAAFCHERHMFRRHYFRYARCRFDFAIFTPPLRLMPSIFDMLIHFRCRRCLL